MDVRSEGVGRRGGKRASWRSRVDLDGRPASTESSESEYGKGTDEWSVSDGAGEGTSDDCSDARVAQVDVLVEGVRRGTSERSHSARMRDRRSVGSQRLKSKSKSGSVGGGETGFETAVDEVVGRLISKVSRG